MTLQDVLRQCASTGSWGGEPIESLEQRNFLGDTPLHTVCSWGECEPVQCLLDAGADIDASGDQGCTPLFNAIGSGNAKLVALLIGRGASPAARNEWGSTPTEYARSVGASADVQALLAPTAKRRR